ncbi:hypothetical protein CBS147309_9761 [Penicillium roqueforti]|nr:hypothetical protein CBS147309_9761 [Penicillium roqueforti]
MATLIPPVSNPTNPPGLLERFANIFYYHPEFQVVLCCQCQCALIQDQLPKHLRETIHLDTQGERITLRPALQYFDNFPKCARQGKDIRYPTEPIPPVLDFPIQRNTLQCQTGDCQWICADLARLQAHIRNKHNPNASFRSKDPKIRIPPHRVVDAQCFITHGPEYRLFPVLCRNSPPPRPPTPTTTSGITPQGTSPHISPQPPSRALTPAASPYEVQPTPAEPPQSVTHSPALSQQTLMSSQAQTSNDTSLQPLLRAPTPATSPPVAQTPQAIPTDSTKKRTKASRPSPAQSSSQATPPPLARAAQIPQAKATDSAEKSTKAPGPTQPQSTSQATLAHSATAPFLGKRDPGPEVAPSTTIQSGQAQNTSRSPLTPTASITAERTQQDPPAQGLSSAPIVHREALSPTTPRGQKRPLPSLPSLTDQPDEPLTRIREALTVVLSMLQRYRCELCCLGGKTQAEASHKITDCPSSNAEVVNQQVLNLVNFISAKISAGQQYPYCTECLLPFSVCRDLPKELQQQGCRSEGCSIPGVVMNAMISIAEIRQDIGDKIQALFEAETSQLSNPDLFSWFLEVTKDTDRDLIPRITQLFTEFCPEVVIGSSPQRVLDIISPPRRVQRPRNS